MVDDWQWGDPKHDMLATLVEIAGAINVKTLVDKKSGVKKSDFPHIQRPWEQTKNHKRIGADPLPLADLDAWLDGDFAQVKDEKHGGQKELPAA